MTEAEASANDANSSLKRLTEMLHDQESMIILYKEAQDADIHEFPASQLQHWYDRSCTLISAQFSFDQGITWESIIDLRNRNGPAFPFLPKSECGEESRPGLGSIEVMRKMVEAARAEVEAMERARDEMEKEVVQQEEMLEKMKEMEQELLRLKLPKKEKYAQVEARMFKVTAKLEREAAEKSNSKPESAAEAKNNNEDGEPDGDKDQLVDEGTGRDHRPEPERAFSVSPPRVSVPRPPIFPMLGPSTMKNDYKANIAMFAKLRDLLHAGISMKTLDATRNTFFPPPTCSVCEDAEPLRDLCNFLEHVLDEKHLGKIASLDGHISAQQCFYWKDILEKGYTTCRPV